MAKKLIHTVLIHSYPIFTTNLGLPNEPKPYGFEEIGKPVKLSRTIPDTYVVCATGDVIEGFITANETATNSQNTIGRATVNGRVVGSVQQDGRLEVVSATALVIGDYVKAGVQPAIGVALATVGAGLTPVVNVDKHTPVVADSHKLRIVGLGPVGSGAAGTILIAEFC